MRETYVLRDGRLVPKRLAVPRTTPARVHVISDAMKPLRHMATGEIIDSKSAFRAATRATGCEEVGSDVNYRPARAELPPIETDIMRAIAEIRSR